jgi:hypothetical protein
MNPSVVMGILCRRMGVPPLLPEGLALLSLFSFGYLVMGFHSSGAGMEVGRWGLLGSVEGFG